MNKISIATFQGDSRACEVYGLWQYDYGQVLRIQDLGLPAAVEIHFSLSEKGGSSITRVGTTRDGVTDVVIPDSMLENDDTSQDYWIYAYIYLTDESSGSTEYKIALKIKSRPRPEAIDRPEDQELFREAIQAVSDAADRAETAEKNAKNSEEDFNKNKLKILAELTRIRQICCDPHLCFENYNGQSAKLESCLELIDSAIEADHKILLFSQFTSMLKIIEERLLEKGIRFYKITGATSKKDRIGMVKQFNDDDTPVFLISLKAGGVGLNLTGADMVIHYDPWWNVAVQNQATDRAHRIGQTKKVTVYKMIAKGTIEEKIVKLQETKKDLADSIISGENVGMSNLSKEDLMELLGI